MYTFSSFIDSTLLRNSTEYQSDWHKWSKFQTPKYFFCSENVLASNAGPACILVGGKEVLQNNVFYEKGEMIMQLLHGFQLYVPIHQMFIISYHHISWTPQQSHFITIPVQIATIRWWRMFGKQIEFLFNIFQASSPCRWGCREKKTIFQTCLALKL